MLYRRPLGNIGFHSRFPIAVSMICFGLLSFAIGCFDMVAYSCRLALVPVVVLNIVSFVYVRFDLLSAFCFAFDLLSSSIVCTSYFPFVVVSRSVYLCSFSFRFFFKSWMLLSLSNYVFIFDLLMCLMHCHFYFV